MKLPDDHASNMDDFFRLIRSSFLTPSSLKIIKEHNLRAAETVLEGMQAAMANQRESLNPKETSPRENTINPQ